MSLPSTAATLALGLWPLLAIGLFLLLRPHRALIAGFVAGWLFLPHAAIVLTGAPDLTKPATLALGALLGVALADRAALGRFRPRPADLPMALWCAVPLLSSMSNGLGLWDGASALLEQTVRWGIPYFLGRLYLASPEARRDLAIAIVAGGVVYVPLCVWEILYGPRLHHLTYGGPLPTLESAFRYGSWRPSVFMQHGLMVSLWLAAAAVVAFWLARATSRRAGGPPAAAALVLALTTLACKSVNGVVLMTVGGALLWSTRRRHGRALLALAILAVPVYVGLRVSGAWDGRGAVAVVSAAFGEARAESIGTRIRNENLILARARERPWLGWGRWSRSMAWDAQHRRRTFPDSLWIGAIGQTGAVGLGAVLLSLVLPVVTFARRHPPATWRLPELAPAAALAVVVLLFAIDCLLNDMRNPVYLLAAGGLLAPPRAAHDAASASKP